MSIRYLLTRQIACDGLPDIPCRDVLNVPGPDLPGAVHRERTRAAKHDGWTYAGRKDYCAAHSIIREAQKAVPDLVQKVLGGSYDRERINITDGVESAEYINKMRAQDG